MVSELSEDRMIQEPKSSVPAWTILAVIAVFAVLVIGGGSWILKKREQIIASNSFSQVTNREFSLFLWQFPEYMRSNVSMKTGYLDGFQYGDKVSIEPGMADKYVTAPPQVLFLYHTWNRLLGSYSPSHPVERDLFFEFLEHSPEWKGENWPGAPKEYQTLMNQFAEGREVDLPLQVRQAFTGWKNFFFDKDLINKVRPTYQQMEDFLIIFPNYARNYWRNLLIKNKPDYLKTLYSGKFEPQEEIPEDQLAPFLKLGYYNEVL